MKHGMKALLSLLLAAVMLSSCLVGCADNQDKETDNTDPAVTEDNSDAPTFREDSFGGEDFKILTYGSTATDFADEYIWSENVSGSTIGDAVMDRNRKVEEKYDVKIVAEECGPMGEAISRMQAGQCDFELIYEWGSRSRSAALDGMLYDCLELPYIDVDQSYWVPSAIEDLTVADRMYIFTNMISMNSFSWADMMYFNKMLMDKFGYDYPYEYVYSDTWIYDNYLDMVIGAEEDLNGDGIMDGNDQFGHSGGPGIGTICDMDLTKENDDGSYTYIGYTEGMIAAYEKYAPILDRVASIGLGTVWEEAGGLLSIFASQHSAARYVIFGEDHALFLGGSMDMTKEFINMKNDYGVCPVPVMNSGDEYKAYVDLNAPLFTLPMQLEDPEMTGIILEYLAYESEEILLPAYYETTIKTKRMEDVRDYDMLDIIRQNTHYKWEYLYMNGDITSVRGSMLTSGHFASVNKRFASSCQAELDDLVETLEAMP